MGGFLGALGGAAKAVGSGIDKGLAFRAKERAARGKSTRGGIATSAAGMVPGSATSIEQARAQDRARIKGVYKYP